MVAVEVDADLGEGGICELADEVHRHVARGLDVLLPLLAEDVVHLHGIVPRDGVQDPVDGLGDRLGVVQVFRHRPQNHLHVDGIP